MENTANSERKIPDFTAPQLMEIIMQMQKEIDRLEQSEPTEFICKCGYGGFDMNSTFIKCMKCDRVYH